jgi:leucyl-tRNA synthetase
MGTRLPWDKDWIIESLSDSTIYMAYYTIVMHIKQNKIRPTQLTDEVFDHIFLGVGKAAEISRKSGIRIELLRQMHDEFTYFYPLDSRHSARELIPNHLTFMIFNHTALFPENLWPRQIVANGVVLMEGAKMSKSFGNIIPLREALAKFGADPVRLGVLSTAELLQDADFSPTIAKSMRDRLERLYRFASELAKTPPKKVPRDKLTAIDRWMLSRLQDHIKKTTEALDKLAARKAIHSVLYELDQDFQWYRRRATDRKGNRSAAMAYVSYEVLDAQIRMLAPVAPHMCEELWEMVGGKSFVSIASWPECDAAKTDVKAEENETLITSVLEDTMSITKATRVSPKRIFYYTAALWKWKVYLKAVEKAVGSKVQQKDLMKELIADPTLKAKAEKVAKFAAQIMDDVNRMSEERKQRILQVGIIDEVHALNEAVGFYEKEINAEIQACNEEDAERYDPKTRAVLARPYRPAIFIE